MFKKIKDGLLVETMSNPQSKRLQKIERFADIPIETRRDGLLVDTPNSILTFNTPKLPKFINAAMYRLQVRPYIPCPLRCVRCQLFGHIALKYIQKPKCVCFKTLQESKPCEIPYKCVNCEGTHSARDPKCPKYLQEVVIQKVKITEKLSYIEAKRKVIINNAIPGLSYAQSMQSPTNSAMEPDIIKELIPQLTQKKKHLANGIKGIKKWSTGKKDKKKSIEKLLEKHYGKEWKKEDALIFFREAFQNVSDGG
ncbi:hypothetical protein NQ314_009477 [Rhamnusium bicolor]|uniref:Pre-C2HC domain-containing protein n=1 Tax=Rhamnusium bicolor TaxID=1586634 RepID=A0AAV8Y2P6_9CUCU|nr:hypothetical protein NQ314_009477 [Rhamnusium bicolor]